MLHGAIQRERTCAHCLEHLALSHSEREKPQTTKCTPCTDMQCTDMQCTDTQCTDMQCTDTQCTCNAYATPAGPLGAPPPTIRFAVALRCATANYYNGSARLSDRRTTAMNTFYVNGRTLVSSECFVFVLLLYLFVLRGLKCWVCLSSYRTGAVQPS